MNTSAGSQTLGADRRLVAHANSLWMERVVAVMLNISTLVMCVLILCAACRKPKVKR